MGKAVKGLVFLFLLSHVGCHCVEGPRQKTLVIWGQSNGVLLAEYISPKWKDCRVINEAVSATSSYQWKNGLYQKLIDTVDKEKPDYVICIQGEGDCATPKEEYFENMAYVWKLIYSKHPDTLGYVSYCSYKKNIYGWGDPRGGQGLLIDNKIALEGPDIDLLRTPELSRDEGLHLNQKGLEVFSFQWRAALGLERKIEKAGSRT